MKEDDIILNNPSIEAADFDRPIGNLIVPLPELVGMCVESKAILMDLLDYIEDREQTEQIRFVNLALSFCADFLADALDEEAAKKTAWKRTRDLIRFREFLEEVV